MNSFKKGKLSDADIAAWLAELRAHPYVPESGFAVTAAVRARAEGGEDYHFAGVNVENADHRLSIHAEESCIAAMVAGLGRQAEIAEVWVLGATCCGKCRQQIAGFAAGSVKVHYLPLKGGAASATTVGAFLPETFTLPQFSEGKKSAPRRTLSAAEVESRLLRKGSLSEKEIADWLKGLESIDYFSKTPQAAVLKLDNGFYAAGAKVEDAAFLSLSAVQSALAGAVSNFGARRVREAWIFTASAALPLSALQSLLQMAESADIPLRLLKEDGGFLSLTLSEAAAAAQIKGNP